MLTQNLTPWPLPPYHQWSNDYTDKQYVLSLSHLLTVEHDSVFLDTCSAWWYKSSIMLYKADVSSSVHFWDKFQRFKLKEWRQFVMPFRFSVMSQIIKLIYIDVTKITHCCIIFLSELYYTYTLKCTYW